MTRKALPATLVAILTVFIASSAAAYDIAVWIPYWSTAALESIQRNGAHVQESNPVWYGIKTDDTLEKFTNAESETWRAAMVGTLIVPSIQNVVNGQWSGATVGAILADPARREVHENSIVQTVVTNAFDGIDLDYEAVPAGSKADFNTFVASLARKLHFAGKILSVTLPSKTNGSKYWAGPSWADYAVVGVHADRVKIMVYDYHWSTSDAGPISPLDWMDQVASYAEQNIPSDKIVIGLPFYGYDWLGKKGAGQTYANAIAKAREQNATITRDTSSGEATFSYADHTVFFNDATSYALKRQLLMEKHPAIRRLAHWAAGQEDPEIWNVIASDFRIAGPIGIVVQAGTSASAEFRVAAGQQFNGTADVTVRSLSGGLPASALSVSSSTASAAAPVIVTVAPAAGTAPGVYRIAVRLTSGTIVHEQIVDVTVISAPVSRSRGVRH